MTSMRRHITSYDTNVFVVVTDPLHIICCKFIDNSISFPSPLALLFPLSEGPKIPSLRIQPPLKSQSCLLGASQNFFVTCFSLTFGFSLIFVFSFKQKIMCSCGTSDINISTLIITFEMCKFSDKQAPQLPLLEKREVTNC